jgi:hypothetical protein
VSGSRAATELSHKAAVSSCWPWFFCWEATVPISDRKAIFGVLTAVLELAHELTGKDLIVQVETDEGDLIPIGRSSERIQWTKAGTPLAAQTGPASIYSLQPSGL